jgi:hypothetical protein
LATTRPFNAACVALHARVDDADAHALPGQAGGLCGTRIGH